MLTCVNKLDIVNYCGNINTWGNGSSYLTYRELIMFILNPELYSGSFKFTEDVLDIGTQEVLYKKGEFVTYLHIITLLREGYEHMPVVKTKEPNLRRLR
jgi:hypothetical protein